MESQCRYKSFSCRTFLDCKLLGISQKRLSFLRRTYHLQKVHTSSTQLHRTCVFSPNARWLVKNGRFNSFSRAKFWVALINVRVYVIELENTKILHRCVLAGGIASNQTHNWGMHYTHTHV